MKKEYTLAALQMAYLQVELAQEEAVVGESCLLCWKKSCGCNAPDVKTDAFINFSDDVVEYKQAILA